MSGTSHGKALLCALTLALSGWMGAVLCAVAEETPPVFSDDEDEAVDIEFLKAGAAAGMVRAQTKLADIYLAGGDFTNAVLWYRAAAKQGEVGAQLTLATCLITGRGAAKDPKEAAHWLRLAADRIEGSVSKPQPPVLPAMPAAHTPAPPVPSIIITRPATPTNAPAPKPAAVELSNAPVAQVFTRVPRSDVLQKTEPVLQEAKPVLKPYSEPR